MMRSNLHHIMEERAPWTSSPNAIFLRQNPILIPRMEIQTHNELHKHCPEVPLLGRYALQSVVNEFVPTSDTLTSLDELLMCIEHATRHPRAHNIERELGQLTMSALELQKPYLTYGILK
jgi:hypothetical protein